MVVVSGPLAISTVRTLILDPEWGPSIRVMIMLLTIETVPWVIVPMGSLMVTELAVKL
jgi:hypothetical protein